MRAGLSMASTAQLIGGLGELRWVEMFAKSIIVREGSVVKGGEGKECCAGDVCIMDWDAYRG